VKSVRHPHGKCRTIQSHHTMEKYPEISQTIIPWAHMYFPSNACAACGSVVPSNIKHFHKLYLHLQTCSIYAEKERALGLNEWDTAYHNNGYIPLPVLRGGVPISKCKDTSNGSEPDCLTQQ
jgi:hypothetical protein